MPDSKAALIIGANVRFNATDTDTTERVYRKVWEVGTLVGFLMGHEVAKAKRSSGRAAAARSSTPAPAPACAPGRGTGERHESQESQESQEDRILLRLRQPHRLPGTHTQLPRIAAAAGLQLRQPALFTHYVDAVFTHTNTD